MNADKLFAQLMDFVPWTSFTRQCCPLWRRPPGAQLQLAEQFRAMAFAQLTYRESLRDIEACLSAQPAKLCPIGFRSRCGGPLLPRPTKAATGASLPITHNVRK